MASRWLTTGCCHENPIPILQRSDDERRSRSAHGPYAPDAGAKPANQQQRWSADGYAVQPSAERCGCEPRTASVPASVSQDAKVSGYDQPAGRPGKGEL